MREKDPSSFRKNKEGVACCFLYHTPAVDDKRSKRVFHLLYFAFLYYGRGLPQRLTMSQNDKDEAQQPGASAPSQTPTTTTPLPHLKLYYFNIKGKGEAIRLYCQFAGLPLEDVRFSSRDEFHAMRNDGKLAFGQVPCLEVTTTTTTTTTAHDNDSTTTPVGVHFLVQTAAIMRYLSKLAGRYPTTDALVAARIDALVDQETDAFTGVTVATYTTRFGLALTDNQKNVAYQHINNEVLPRHLEALETVAAYSATPWLAGTDEPSIADFVWYVRLHHLLPEKAELSQDIQTLQDYPALRRFCMAFDQLEAIQAYYKKGAKRG